MKPGYIEPEDPCLQCGKPLGCEYFTEGNSRASHYACYHRAHPPRLATTIEEMIYSSEDPQLSRRLCLMAITTLSDHVYTLHLLGLFNSELRLAHARRIAE